MSSRIPMLADYTAQPLASCDCESCSGAMCSYEGVVFNEMELIPAVYVTSYNYTLPRHTLNSDVMSMTLACRSLRYAGTEEEVCQQKYFIKTRV
jgi:hypothetical protein